MSNQTHARRKRVPLRLPPGFLHQRRSPSIWSAVSEIMGPHRGRAVVSPVCRKRLQMRKIVAREGCTCTPCRSVPARDRALSATHPHVRSPACTTRHRSACARRRPGGDGAEVTRAERASAATFEASEACWKKLLLRGARGSLLRGGRWAVPRCGELASPGQHHTAHLSPYSCF